MESTALLTAACQATAELELAQKTRDDAIRAASAGGNTIRTIAAATGLSTGRVGQIVQAGT